MSAQELAFLRDRAAAVPPMVIDARGDGARRGESAPANRAAALRGVTAAAARGDGRAQAELGRRYARGEGVGRRIGVAEFWLRAAVAQDEAGAAYELARLVDAGEIREENPGEAASWWRSAAAAGIPEARLRLGLGVLEFAVARPMGGIAGDRSANDRDEIAEARVRQGRWSDFRLGPAAPPIAAAS